MIRERRISPEKIGRQGAWFSEKGASRAALHNAAGRIVGRRLYPPARDTPLHVIADTFVYLEQTDTHSVSATQGVTSG